MAERRMVVVDWVDSATCNGWGALEQFPIPATANCQSVGFVLRRNKSEIVLCQQQGETRVGDIIAIPAGCIKRVRRLVPNGG